MKTLVISIAAEQGWRAVCIELAEDGASYRLFVRYIGAWGLFADAETMPLAFDPEKPNVVLSVGLGLMGLFGGSEPTLLPLDELGPSAEERVVKHVRWLVPPTDKRTDDVLLAEVKAAVERFNASMSKPLVAADRFYHVLTEKPR